MSLSAQVDHWERAKRLVEIPLLEKEYQQQIVDDKAFHEQQEEERVATEIRERKEMEENRERMGRMEPSRDRFWRWSGGNDRRLTRSVSLLARGLEEQESYNSTVYPITHSDG